MQVGRALCNQQWIVDFLEVHCEVVKNAQVEFLKLRMKLTIFILSLLQKTEGFLEELRKVQSYQAEHIRYFRNHASEAKFKCCELRGRVGQSQYLLYCQVFILAGR